MTSCSDRSRIASPSLRSKCISSPAGIRNDRERTLTIFFTVFNKCAISEASCSLQVPIVVTDPQTTWNSRGARETRDRFEHSVFSPQNSLVAQILLFCRFKQIVHVVMGTMAGRRFVSALGVKKACSALDLTSLPDSDLLYPSFLFHHLLNDKTIDYCLQCDEKRDSRPSKWLEETVETLARGVQGEHG